MNALQRRLLIEAEFEFYRLQLGNGPLFIAVPDAGLKFRGLERFSDERLIALNAEIRSYLRSTDST